MVFNLLMRQSDGQTLAATVSISMPKYIVLWLGLCCDKSGVDSLCLGLTLPKHSPGPASRRGILSIDRPKHNT